MTTHEMPIADSLIDNDGGLTKCQKPQEIEDNPGLNDQPCPQIIESNKQHVTAWCSKCPLQAQLLREVPLLQGLGWRGGSQEGGRLL